MSVTIEDIEPLRRVLAELPRHQPKEVTEQEAIALLASELSTARRRGYKPNELARILSERGLAIDAATLRGYPRRNRRSRGRREGKARGRPRRQHNAISDTDGRRTGRSSRGPRGDKRYVTAEGTRDIRWGGRRAGPPWGPRTSAGPARNPTPWFGR